jgi:SAM-dependent methyltransferase
VALVDLRNALAKPALYTLFQRLVRGPGEALYVTKHVKPRPGDRVLDIGCGTGDILRHMPPVSYVGFDMDEDLIRAARKNYGHRGRFFRGRVSADIVRDFPPFDLVVATGILHHLPDHDAVELFQLAANALKPGHRLVTLDGCFTQEQSRFARFVLSRDRGRYVRPPEKYRELAASTFSSVVSMVYDDLLRIPSSIIVMECTRGL